jgi:hypothetical protein
MKDLDINNSDIRALLILLLLKTGTSSSEIVTALQMAATARVVMTPDRSDTGDASEAIAEVDRRLAETKFKNHSVTPKQALRNVHLAPVRGYAA